jgi:hypothetical protein
VLIVRSLIVVGELCFQADAKQEGFFFRPHVWTPIG